MSEHCHIDVETFSAIDLIKAGAYRYAEDDSTDLLCVCYAFGDGPIHLWVPADGVPAAALPDTIDGQTTVSPRPPQDLRDWMASGKQCRAHNAAFERVILNGVVGERYHIPQTTREQWVCTAAKAAAYALPRGLGDAASAIGAPAKSATGRNVMLKLSRPRKPTIKLPQTRFTPEMDPKSFAILYAYCADDVRAERGIDKRLRDLSDYEQEVYVLDQKINDRGLLIDMESVHNVQALVEDYRQSLEAACEQITGGVRVSQTAALAEWIRANGYDLENLQAETVAQALKDPAAPEQIREVLRYRYLHSMKAPAKYVAMEKAVCEDNRLRGMFIYHGASTGRWVSKIVQMQNLHRGYIKDPSVAIEAYRERDLDWVKTLYQEDPMKVFSSTVRGMIKAAAGHDIMALDFSQIEARVLPWMCGQKDTLRVFESGRDVYVHAAARIFSVKEDKVDDKMRFAGKISTLSCGYQGAVGAYTRMAKNYGVAVDEAVALKVVKDWREANPKIVESWYATEAAAKEAIRRPGDLVHIRDRDGELLDIGKHICFKVHRGFLRMRLPSGRMLSYFRPFLNDEEQLCFWGVDTFSRKWGETSTYGGSLVQSATQAIARDLMVNGMRNLDGAGYTLIGTVHDEVIMEVPEDFGSVEDAAALMCWTPDWAQGLPVKATGYRDKRYKKE